MHSCCKLERNLDIYYRWKRGERQTDIAALYNISPPRVLQIIQSIEFHKNVNHFDFNCIKRV